METKKIEDITIENMLQNIFVNQRVKKRRKDIVAYYTQVFDLGLFSDAQCENAVTHEEITAKVDEVLRLDKKEQTPFLKYSNGYYFKQRRAITKPVNPVSVNSIYIGTAGECAVMSELLYRGYNVNSMMVDEGIDLVASKNNVFFYIQVKTSSVSQQNRFYFSIKRDRFDAFIGTQMRYILVARCNVNQEDKNIFFIFNNSDIGRYMFNQNLNCNSDDAGRINIKIELDQRTGKAILYDKQKVDVTFHMNNFDL